ncbi:MAG TPA: hypothetical protein VEI07_16840 [Planctomycetaceae bacterium]|nr:hypothetical protein [Planctomycetaceae bacterium]
MLSKISKVIAPAMMFAVVAVTLAASSPEAFAKGGHGGRGGHGRHGLHRGHRFGHFRHRGYFGYRNYGWGWYNGYAFPDCSCGCEETPVSVAPVCTPTVVASVYSYPIYGGCCDDGGFGWGGRYRDRFWGHRGFRHGGRGGRGGHGRR